MLRTQSRCHHDGTAEVPPASRLEPRSLTLMYVLTYVHARVQHREFQDPDSQVTDSASEESDGSHICDLQLSVTFKRMTAPART